MVMEREGHLKIDWGERSIVLPWRGDFWGNERLSVKARTGFYVLEYVSLLDFLCIHGVDTEIVLQYARVYFQHRSAAYHRLEEKTGILNSLDLPTNLRCYVQACRKAYADMAAGRVDVMTFELDRCLEVLHGKR